MNPKIMYRKALSHPVSDIKLSSQQMLALITIIIGTTSLTILLSSLTDQEIMDDTLKPSFKFRL